MIAANRRTSEVQTPSWGSAATIWAAAGHLPWPLPVVAIPVCPDGQPDPAHRTSGVLLDLRSQEMTLILQRGEHLSALMVGVQIQPDRPYYAGIVTVDANRQPDGQIQLHGCFGGPGQELLEPKNLMPRFDFDSLTFAFGFPLEVLHRWVDLGVLQTVAIDQLHLCPRCHGLPTIHRFDLEQIPVVHCLRCAYLFDEQEALKMTLQGYRAHRLQPPDPRPLG